MPARSVSKLTGRAATASGPRLAPQKSTNAYTAGRDQEGDPRRRGLCGEPHGGHDVRQKSHGRKRFNHPVVGELTLDYETLTLPTEPDQSLVAFTAKPGSPSETSLKLLAAWAASAA